MILTTIRRARVGMLARVLTVALPGFVLHAAQPPQLRAEDVLARAREAVGGTARLDRVRTLAVEGRYSASFPGIQAQAHGPIEYFVQFPGQFKIVQGSEMSGAEGVFADVRTLDGDGDWVALGVGMKGRNLTPGQDADTPELRARDHQVLMTEFARCVLAWLVMVPPGSDVRSTYLGLAQAPDGRAHTLEFTGPSGDRERLFVDDKSYQPLLLTFEAPPPKLASRRASDPRTSRGGQDSGGSPATVTHEWHLEDYRAVEGIRMPHRITHAIAGGVYVELTFSRISINPSLPPETFRRPGR